MLKNQRGSCGSGHGPTWVLGAPKGAALTTPHKWVSCLHKAGNELGISHGNTLGHLLTAASTLCPQELEGSFAQFCKIKIARPPRYPRFKAEGSWEPLVHIFNRRQKFS